MARQSADRRKGYGCREKVHNYENFLNHTGKKKEMTLSRTVIKTSYRTIN